MNRYLPALWAALFAFAAVSAASAASYPAYTCTELIGYSLSTSGTPTSACGWNLLPNGTVIGESTYQSPNPTNLPVVYLESWNSSGVKTDIYNCGTVTVKYDFGDSSGRVAAVLAGASSGVYLYSNGTFAPISQAMGNNYVIAAMSPNGLITGDAQGGISFAYDAATSHYYSIGPTGSTPNNVNANGYVVGWDAHYAEGFVWQESNQNYTEIAGLAAAQGISNNNQYVVGPSQDNTSVAQEYSLSGNLLKSFWTGEATGVNNSGIVIGDNSEDIYNYTGGEIWSSRDGLFPRLQ